MANVNSVPKSLPEILPVFPLTGVLVFPGMILPLHIFEPRYRNLAEDVLSAEGVFGMIQPVVPREDNRPLPGMEKETPELYGVGSAGYIKRRPDVLPRDDRSEEHTSEIQSPSHLV